MCKIIISGHFFVVFFLILIFRIVRWGWGGGAVWGGEGERAKSSPKRHKILFVALLISGTIHHMI